mmetsp:Transcript_50552/g.114832  ORF Transcript_50552/g.114832 Transcript_50552/m.114832 type:complete len:341 (-) Transcript_50552:1225-2247(-)
MGESTLGWRSGVTCPAAGAWKCRTKAPSAAVPGTEVAGGASGEPGPSRRPKDKAPRSAVWERTIKGTPPPEPAPPPEPSPLLAPLAPLPAAPPRGTPPAPPALGGEKRGELGSASSSLNGPRFASPSASAARARSSSSPPESMSPSSSSDPSTSSSLSSSFSRLSTPPPARFSAASSAANPEAWRAAREARRCTTASSSPMSAASTLELEGLPSASTAAAAMICSGEGGAAELAGRRVAALALGDEEAEEEGGPCPGPWHFPASPSCFAPPLSCLAFPSPSSSCLAWPASGEGSAASSTSSGGNRITRFALGLVEWAVYPASAIPSGPSASSSWFSRFGM